MAFQSPTVHAQQAAAPADTAAAAPAAAASAPTGDAAVRNALAKNENDVDEQSKLLKDTLTATDKQYSLIKKGSFAATYNMSYTYVGSQLINAQFNSGNTTLTLFDIENTRSHTITNTLSVDYGLENNLTGNVTLPIVDKYSQGNSFSGTYNDFGDLSFGVRWQPMAQSRDLPSVIGNVNLSLPTGRSPFDVISGTGLQTGNGYATLSSGVNVSKVIDPVAVFGSASIILGAPAKHLSQVNNGEILKEVRPAPSLAFGAGFAYALSYKVSTTASFQEVLSSHTKLTFSDGTVQSTAPQTQGIVSFGLGVRTSPQTTMNFSVGIGLTPDSPNFTLGFNMPLHF
ncbi:MAG: transporter [Burkholderiaceae bacterium]|nr:transporter [Burkholderiaceae bacterium]